MTTPLTDRTATASAPVLGVLLCPGPAAPPAAPPPVQALPAPAPLPRQRFHRDRGDYLYVGLQATKYVLLATIGYLLWLVGAALFAAFTAHVAMVGAGVAIIAFAVWATRTTDPGSRRATSRGAPAAKGPGLLGMFDRLGRPGPDVEPAAQAAKGPGLLGMFDRLGRPGPDVALAQRMAVASASALGGRGTSKSGPAGDDLTQRWIADMRSGRKQLWGRLRDAPTYKHKKKDEEVCALGSLYDTADPNGWRWGRCKRKLGGNWDHDQRLEMEARYGKRLLSDVQELNDGKCWSLPKIADYVERRTK